MSMKMRPDYVNPLTVNKTNVWKPGQTAPRQDGQLDKASELQTKQQQLQNQVLLLRASGTDSAGATAEMQKGLEAELEAVSAELRTAKADVGLTVEGMACLEAHGLRHSRDWYEPGGNESASPGIYRVENDEEQGYHISFLPYSKE